MIYDHQLIGWAYRKSPFLLQNAMISGYGLLQRWERRGRGFRRILDELDRSEDWNASQLEALQAERLQRLIRHAYENVPYYRRVFDERRLSPADIRRPADLYKLPVLTKQAVRNSYLALRARGFPRHRIRIARTGGSTGVPLKLLLDQERIMFDHALVRRHWSWAGYRIGDRIAILRGLTLVSPEDRSSRYWRRDWVENKMYFSSFHLSTETMPLYVQKLQEWEPKFIAGYPSALFTLARFMNREGIRLAAQAIFASSETISDLERRVIEDRFQCRVWDRYGTAERLAVTQQCEYGNYHQNSEFGILQVDSPLGEPSAPGKSGELVLTGLTNFSMPLIRYSTEDIGRLIDIECRCGRQLPLAGPVEGRKDDVIVTADQRLMPRAGLDQIHEFVENIDRCQLIQREVGEVTVRVQPRPGFGESDSAELVRQLRARLGNDMRIRIEQVKRLELSTAGKQRFIVSRVDINRITGIELELQSAKRS